MITFDSNAGEVFARAARRPGGIRRVTRRIACAAALAAVAACSAHAFAAALAADSLANPAASRDSASARKPAPTVTDERARAIAQLSEPGPQHQRLKSLVGHWSSVSRVTPTPGADVIEVPSSAEYRSILGGRFVMASSQIEFGGETGYGMTVYGYDRFKNRYTFYYIQDHDTQSLSGLGTPDATGQTIVFDVTMDVPLTGETGKHYRTLLTFDGPNQHTFEMWTAGPDGKEWRPLQIVYTRE
jgi:hypothetical protein